MDFFSQILGITSFRVAHVETRGAELHLHLECESGTAVCSRCGHLTRQVRQKVRRVIRDLPLSGKACYLHLEKRYFDCVQCHHNFPESFEFVDPKRDYTRRYEESLFHQVRQTTIKYVADREKLTDKVVL